MAETQKMTFPTMPVGHWGALREKFKQTIPGIVTDNYLSSVLQMTVSSARTNILPSLRSVGLIDENGKPTDLAKKWRDDHEYPTVCSQIRKSVYPQELLDAIPGPTVDRAGCTRWFANHTGAGQGAIGKMVAFYSLVTEANPAKSDKRTDTPKPTAKKLSSSKPNRVAKLNTGTESVVSPEAVDTKHKQGNIQPAIHLNLQIHISADASSEQIDKIFESMAKHLYRQNLTNE